MAARLQLRTVNAALSVRGVKERLYRGEGYFYFIDGDAHKWGSTSVYVHNLNDLSLPQWLDEWKRCAGVEKFPLEK